MKYCSKCGAELLDEAVVCPKCGCPVEGANPIVDEGSKPLGFVLGFALGLIGLLVAYLGIKKPLTKKGALVGFLVSLGLSIVYSIITVISSLGVQ